MLKYTSLQTKIIRSTLYSLNALNWIKITHFKVKLEGLNAPKHVSTICDVN